MSEELEKRIKVLERKLNREKRARLESEGLLEKKSAEIFQTNVELTQQIADTKAQQRHLSFLTGLAGGVFQANSIDALIKLYVKKGSEFLTNADSVFLQLAFDGESVFISDKVNVSVKDKSRYVELSELIARFDLDKLVTMLKDDKYESQFFSAESLSNNAEDTGHCFIVPVFHFRQQICLACYFYYSSDDIDVARLQSMESARNSIDLAIQQKLTAIKLQYRYTELKESNQQLKEAQRQLVQSEKMASIGQLAAGVAHEINNPIGFVLSNVDTLKDYLKSIQQILQADSEFISAPDVHPNHASVLQEIWDNEGLEFIREDLDEIVASSLKGLKRVQEIVSGLKTFTHISEDIHGELNVNDSLNDAIQLLHNELKYDYEVHVDLQATHVILGRAGALQQVFVNMLMNAKQAMEDGGDIYVSSKNLVNGVLVEIRDTGCGMSEEDKNKLFTPFFTTKPVGVGTGLGLSISYGILNDHKAKVTVNSKLGKGTSFLMQFPKA